MKDEFDDDMELPDDELMADESTATATITGVIIATGVQSNNSANCAIARSGNVARVSSSSASSCSNSSDA